MKTRVLILLAIATILLIGISDESFADKRIKLHLGQTTSTENLRFTLHDVYDSRCPSDVTCVWDGQVTATIQIQNNTHTKMIDLIPHDSYVFFSPYKVILLDVSPYPVSAQKPDDHVVTLLMQNRDEVLSCGNRMKVEDGLCVPKAPRDLDFRVSGEGLSLLYTFTSLSLVGIVVGFFGIKKWKNRK